MIEGYMESSLATSEIYNGLNSIEGAENTTQKAIRLIKTAKHLTNEDIETAYIAVKQITDTLTREALKAFDNEKTVIVYSNVPALRVTHALPFITFKNKAGNNITYIFADQHISVNRDNVMNIPPAVLRDLLTGAVVANGIKTNYSKLSTNEYLQSTLMSIYTQFVMRILNVQYQINPDRTVADKVQYWINKFFLLRVFGANNTAENIETIATKHYRYIDELQATEIKHEYDLANPAKFSELLDLIKTASPRMKDLNMASFLSQWTSYYYPPAMLAIDNIEYLIFMIITLLGGTNIISIRASDIVKEAKNIKSLRSELLKLI